MELTGDPLVYVVTAEVDDPATGGRWAARQALSRFIVDDPPALAHALPVVVHRLIHRINSVGLDAAAARWRAYPTAAVPIGATP